MRLKFNDRYIRGTAFFERNDERARMSYKGTTAVPVNSQYDIDGVKWVVVQTTPSDYNPGIFNVDMELVSG